MSFLLAMLALLLGYMLGKKGEVKALIISEAVTIIFWVLSLIIR